MPSSNLTEAPELVADAPEAPEPAMPQLIMIELDSDDEAGVCGPDGVCL